MLFYPPFESSQKIGEYRICQLLKIEYIFAIYSIENSSLVLQTPLKMENSDPKQLEFANKNYYQLLISIKEKSFPGLEKIAETRLENNWPCLFIHPSKGDSLKKKMQEGIHFDRSMEIAYFLIQALQKLHAQKIHHSGVTPSNIYISEDQILLKHIGWRKYLQDLKFSKYLCEIEYLAPEQLEGKETEEKTDIYAWGIILHEMLFQTPYFCNNMRRFYEKIISPKNQFSNNKKPNIDKFALQICKKAMDKDPGIRYPSTVEIRQDIEKWFALKIKTKLSSAKDFIRKGDLSQAIELLQKARGYGKGDLQVDLLLGKVWSQYVKRSVNIVAMNQSQITIASKINKLKHNEHFFSAHAIVKAKPPYFLIYKPQGNSLADLLKQGKRISPEKIPKLAQCIQEAIEALSLLQIHFKITLKKIYFDGENFKIAGMEKAKGGIISYDCKKLGNILALCLSGKTHPKWSELPEVYRAILKKSIRETQYQSLKELVQDLKNSWETHLKWEKEVLSWKQDLGYPETTETKIKPEPPLAFILVEEDDPNSKEIEILIDDSALDSETEKISYLLPSGFRYKSEFVLCEKDMSEMAIIESGYFYMGKENGREDERPVHKIYLNTYLIDRYPVTWNQYLLFCKETGHPEPIKPKWKNFEDHPVVCVTWQDAVAYCNWVGKTLPTEAQWEKAARGGLWLDGVKSKLKANPLNQRTYPWGDQQVEENNIWRSNFEKTPQYGNRRTSPVGIFKEGTSPYQCMDMSGNVWEWCSDFYEEHYYHQSPEKNPQGPETGSYHVIRGGCWNSNQKDLRVSSRGVGCFLVYVGRDNVGFRCALSI